MIKALEGKINKTDELVKNNVNVETTNNKKAALANDEDDDEEQANSDNDNDVTNAVSTTVKNRCIVCYRLLKNWKGNRLAKYSDISVDLGANDLNVSTTTTLVNRKKPPAASAGGGQDSHRVFNLIKKYLISTNNNQQLATSTNLNGSRLLNSLFVDVNNNNNTTGTNGNKKSTLNSLADINNNKNKNDQIKKSVPCSFKLCQSCHECINQIDDHMRNFQKLRRLMRTRLDKSFRLIKLKRLKQQQQQKAQVNVTTTNGPLLNGQNGRVRQHRSLLLVNGSKNSGLNKLMKTFHSTANKSTTKTTTLNVQLSPDNDSFYLPTTADRHKTPSNQSTSSLRRDCIYMIDDIHDDSVKIENNNNLNTASNSNEAGCCVDQNSNSPNAENQSSNRRKRKSRNPSRLSNKDEYNGQSTYSEIQYCNELKENTSTSSTNAKLNKKSDLNAHPSAVDSDTIDLLDKIKSNAKTNHNNNNNNHINNTISNNNKNLTRNANRYDHANSNSKQLVHVGTTTGALHNVNSSSSSSSLSAAQKSLESRILNSANKNSSASSSSSSNPLARLNLEQQLSIKILDPHAIASTAIESTKSTNGPNTKTIKLFKNKENADNKLTSSNQPAQQQHLLLLLPPPPPLSHSNELQLQLQSPSSKRPVLNRPTRHHLVVNAAKSKLKANDFNNNKENDLIDQNNNNLNGAGDEINDENDELNEAEHELNNNNNSLDDDEELIHGDDDDYMDDVTVNNHKLHIGNDNDDEDVDYDGEIDDQYPQYENIHNTVEDVIEDETLNGNVDDDDDDVESQVMNGANGYQLDDDDNDNDEEEDEQDEDENENELDNDDDEDEDDDDENDNDNDNDDDDEDEDYNEPGHIASLLSSSKARKSPATMYHNLTSILSGSRNRTSTGNRKSGANVNSRSVKGDRSLAAAIKYENASSALAAGHTASLLGLSQLNNHHNHHNHHHHNQGNQRNDTSKHCCNICKKSFKTQNILRQHMRIHTGDKPFVCEICNKAFSQMASLKYHLATHSDDRPFKCEDCSKTFKLKPPFKKHIKECPQRLQKLQEQKLTTAHAASGSGKQKQASPPSSASNLSNNSSSVSPLYFNQHK